jgi:hypothetical protein
MIGGAGDMVIVPAHNSETWDWFIFLTLGRWQRSLSTK